MTLSSWLRDYLYIPLGGSRLGETRTPVNLMITMALGGLWHGASWNFVIWGVFHGAGLIVHRLTPGLRDALPMGVRTYGGWLMTVTFVMAGWGIFRAHSFSDLTNLARAVVTVNRIDPPPCRSADVGVTRSSRPGDDSAVLRRAIGRSSLD